MMVFDRDGNFLRSWGEGLFPRAHGLHMAPDDTIFLTDDGDHTVRQCTLDGKVLLTLGTPGKPAPFMSGRAVPSLHAHGAVAARATSMCRTATATRGCTSSRRTGGMSDVVGRGRTPTRASSTSCTTSPATPTAGSMSPTARTTASRCSTATARYETQWNNLHRPCGLFMPACKCPICYVGELGPARTLNRNFPNLGPRRQHHRQHRQAAGAHRRAASRHRARPNSSGRTGSRSIRAATSISARCRASSDRGYWPDQPIPDDLRACASCARSVDAARLHLPNKAFWTRSPFLRPMARATPALSSSTA